MAVQDGAGPRPEDGRGNGQSLCGCSGTHYFRHLGRPHVSFGGAVPVSSSNQELKKSTCPSPHICASSPSLSGLYTPLGVKSEACKALCGVASSGSMSSLTLSVLCPLAELEWLRFSPLLPASKPLCRQFPLPGMLFRTVITRPNAPLPQLTYHFLMEPFPGLDQDQSPW